MDMVASILNKTAFAQRKVTGLSCPDHACASYYCIAPTSQKLKSSSLPYYASPKWTQGIYAARDQTVNLSAATNPLKKELAAQETLPLYVEHFHLPDLSCSLPLKRHPDYENIREIVDPWMLEWTRPRTEQEKKFYVQSEITGISCLIVPECPYKIRLLNLCKFMVCFLLFDDISDDTVEISAGATGFDDLINSIIRAVECRSSADDLRLPHINAVSSILQHMRADMSARIYQRHVHALKDFIDSMQNQTGFRELPDLRAFIHSRRQTVAFQHMQVMVEYCLGIELDDETLESQSMQDLHHAAMDYVAWSNDLLSFRREYYSSNVHNLPSVLYYHHGGSVSFQDVVCETYEMIKQREQDVLQLLAETTASKLAKRKPELRLYLHNLPYCVSGLLEWFYTSARFHGVDHSVGKIRHGFVHMDPERTIITPTPVL